MAKRLPEPEIVRCYFDDSFDPSLPAMCLRWRADSSASVKPIWKLPEGIRVVGPAPECFGISIQRQSENGYSVRLLWDRSCFRWTCLSRNQLLRSSLAPLLAAMGTDLWYLLEQPMEAESGAPMTAA